VRAGLNTSSAAEDAGVYRFTGFFVRPAIERPAALPAGVIWREVAAPFAGVGVYLPGLVGKKPGLDEARQLLAEVGLNGAADWLFIDYVTWAGRIDSVSGLGSSGGRAFGPVAESDGEKTRAAYLKLMGAFGVAEVDAFDFPPFVRGFFNE
jgi:hypothetical protein